MVQETQEIKNLKQEVKTLKDLKRRATLKGLFHATTLPLITGGVLLAGGYLAYKNMEEHPYAVMGASILALSVGKGIGRALFDKRRDDIDYFSNLKHTFSRQIDGKNQDIRSEYSKQISCEVFGCSYGNWLDGKMPKVGIGSGSIENGVYVEIPYNHCLDGVHDANRACKTSVADLVNGIDRNSIVKLAIGPNISRKTSVNGELEHHQHDQVIKTIEALRIELGKPYDAEVSFAK